MVVKGGLDIKRAKMNDSSAANEFSGKEKRVNIVIEVSIVLPIAY